MTGRIVVGLDGSPNSTAAARWAFDEARRRDAKVEVVTVFGLLGPGDLPDRSDLVTDHQLADACARMQDEQLSGIRGHDVSVTTRIEHGDPAHTLVSAARDADLLVLGARGRAGITELLLGSVSLHCAQRATCPVAVVPAYVPDAGREAPVVVGVDDSPAGKAAVQVAAQEAVMRGTHVVAVHAVNWSMTGTDLVRPTDDQLVEWGTRLLAGVIGPVQAEWPDLVFEQRVVPGHPAQVLGEAAADADLLVVGSRGHGQLTGRLVGSVSLHLLTHARRPTIVVVA